jgi:hypothetical protein
VVLGRESYQPDGSFPDTTNDAFNKLAMVLHYLCNDVERLRQHVRLFTRQLRWSVRMPAYITVHVSGDKPDQPVITSDTNVDRLNSVYTPCCLCSDKDSQQRLNRLRHWYQLSQVY